MTVEEGRGTGRTPVNDSIPLPRYRFFIGFVASLDATTTRG